MGILKKVNASLELSMVNGKTFLHTYLLQTKIAIAGIEYAACQHKFKELPFFILHDLGILNMTNEKIFTLIREIFLKYVTIKNFKVQQFFLYESFTFLDGMYFDSE